MSTRPDARRLTDVLRIAPSIAAALFLVAAALGGSVHASVGETPPGRARSDGLYLNWLDRSVAPREDFFRFANGGWLKSHPIPPDRAYWGVDTILEQENQTFIRTLVESLTQQDWPADSPQRKVADFYASGMDEHAIEAAGAAPLQQELDRIAAIATPAELPQEFAHLQSIGVEAPLSIGQMQDFKDSTRVIAVASQSGLGLPNRDYYLKTGPTFQAARQAYGEHIRRMFVLLGDTGAAAARESRDALALEMRLAIASMSDIEQRDPHAIYHPMTIEGARTLAPHLNWPQLFGGLGHPEISSLNVGMPKFFEAVDRELTSTPLENWKAYLRWQLIDSYAPYLSSPFVDEDFRMTAALTGEQELQVRWLRVLKAEDEALGFAIGQLYVAQKFPPAAKEAAAAMVSHIRDALQRDLGTLAWMTPQTRAAAQRKLSLMELRIGYPDRWRDYSALAIDRGPYALNVMRANAFEVQRQLAKIGKPVDRSEWYMTPQTVNAYYDPSMNSLNLPAGILQPPYFDASWPDAVNYGATGATIGHEMTHGFDDEGAQFDGYGNLKDWWAPTDLAKFRAATRCISEQYSRFTVSGGLHVQGDLVTGEATADLGGVILAWRALHAPGMPASSSGGAREFTPDQQFFIAFAHSWAGVMRAKQAEKMVTTDPHPPAEDRTDGTLANVPEFQTAFAISNPSPMVKKDRCVIW
jgi:putative endopeptidase